MGKSEAKGFLAGIILSTVVASIIVFVGLRSTSRLISIEEHEKITAEFLEAGVALGQENYRAVMQSKYRGIMQSSGREWCGRRILSASTFSEDTQTDDLYLCAAIFNVDGNAEPSEEDRPDRLSSNKL